MKSSENALLVCVRRMSDAFGRTVLSIAALNSLPLSREMRCALRFQLPPPHLKLKRTILASHLTQAHTFTEEKRKTETLRDLKQ